MTVLSKLSPPEFKKVALIILHRPNQRENWTYTEKSQAKTWASFYGTTPEVATEVWNRLVDKDVIPDGGAPKHLLYAYVLLKKYAGDEGNAKIVGCHSNTFRHWAWIFIPLVHDLHHDVIVFGNRRIGWDTSKTNAAVVTDATTYGCLDCRPFDKAMWDVKRSKAGLKYEVALGIHSGYIVHWDGWHKGSVADIEIFRNGLMTKLDTNECVEADAGCSGENCLKNPQTAKSRRVKQQKGVLRAREECIFCKTKKFQSMRGIWIHSYDKHKLAVGAILVTLQLGLEIGTVKLWAAEYEAEYF